MTLLVATRSRGKQDEFLSLLKPINEVLTFPDALGIVETEAERQLECWDSFSANARAKAEYFSRLSGLPTLADDSGLEVAALAGAPGVHSKRFAGMDGPDHLIAQVNNQALLAAISALEQPERCARYRCVLALARPDRPTRLWEGSCNGRILREPMGRAGFGYDPIFFSFELDKGFGMADPGEKAAVSHRGRAVQALIADWPVP